MIAERNNLLGIQYSLTLKRQSSRTIELSDSPSGNLIRINNALDNIAADLAKAERELANIEKQLADAKIEVKKPFPRDQELKDKMIRLAELNSLLDIDKKDHVVAMDDETSNAQGNKRGRTC